MSSEDHGGLNKFLPNNELTSVESPSHRGTVRPELNRE